MSGTGLSRPTFKAGFNHRISGIWWHLWGRIRNIGPGIVVSGCIIGSGELIVTTTMGARHGYTFLWAVIICCIIKYFIQIELGRYCIVNNFTTIQALNQVPGLKWRNTSWIVYVFFAAVIMLIAALSGILASVAGILLVNFPAIGSFGWHVIVALVVGLILFWGFYNVIETLVSALVASFSIVVVISTFLIQGTPYQFGLGDVARKVLVGTGGREGAGHGEEHHLAALEELVGGDVAHVGALQAGTRNLVAGCDGHRCFSMIFGMGGSG